MRARITFSRGPEIKYISHLDLLRMWERILRRARVPLAFSKGFNPHPRLALAAPLPVGVLATAEILEIHLDPPMPPPDLERAIHQQLPPGVRVSHVEEVEDSGPSLPSLVRAAEYEVQLAEATTRREVEERIDRLLGTRTLLRERMRQKAPKGEARKEEPRQYDLRPLVEDIWIERWNGEKIIAMRLRADPAGTGRPEEVLDELRMLQSVLDITRTKLILATTPP